MKIQKCGHFRRRYKVLQRTQPDKRKQNFRFSLHIFFLSCILLFGFPESFFRAFSFHFFVLAVFLVFFRIFSPLSHQRKFFTSTLHQQEAEFIVCLQWKRHFVNILVDSHLNIPHRCKQWPPFLRNPWSTLTIEGWRKHHHHHLDHRKSHREDGRTVPVRCWERNGERHRPDCRQHFQPDL